MAPTRVAGQQCRRAKNREVNVRSKFTYALVIASVAALPFFITAHAATPAAAPQPAAGTTGDKGESRFVQLDGMKVHYKNYGKGSEALVFVHGWTCNLAFWSDQIPAFIDRTRVIAVDLPGHGQSDKPNISYTMDLFARAVDAVLKDAGVNRAVIVGHSMGVPVARQFYRKYPKQTLAIVAVDGPLKPFADAKMMETLIASFRGPDYKQVATGFIDGMMGPEVPVALRERVKTSMLSTPQSVAVSAMEGMADPSIWTQDKINVPMLAVLAKSPFWPPDAEAVFRSLVTDLDYQMWDGVTHFLMMEKPKEFNAAVIAFLDKRNLLKKGK
jgi:pimeloyl-ACP methyl ester carboxylesterase